MKGLTWRIIAVVTSIVFSVYLLLPTAIKYTTGKQIGRIVKPEDPWYFHVLPSEVLKLGLDLMGGLHLVVGIDFDEVHRDSVVKMKNQLTDMVTNEKIEGVTFEATDDGMVNAKFASDAQWEKVEKVVARDYGNMLDFVDQTKSSARLRLSTLYLAEVRNRAIDQSLETLRNRIDEFGIAEPIISRQGEDKILIQFPGVQEAGRLKEIISRTAKLSFQIVRTGPETPSGPPTEDQLKAWVAEFEKAKNIKPDPVKPISDYVRQLNAFLKGKTPEGTEVYFHKETNVNTKQTTYTPYLLDREALVTGEDLADAYYSFNQQDGSPLVNFQLTPVGATKFEKATGANVGKFFAIVLDGNVHSAPRIKTRIPGGRAVIEMGSVGRGTQEVMNEAKDTSLVLRSGALPARLLFLEERVIGPSLGADSIRAGTQSLAFGLALIFIFLFVYYRASGGVAAFALALNGLFVLSFMAAFEGTLTLPGLAGLTLTLGMAVDANVLIFEHMREEILNGKSVNSAIAEGYSRAFSAILDGNITTILAGLVLLSFGYGPIRGFAVTMLIGLAASMFTAVFVTRVVFDWWIVSKNRKTISL